MNPIRATNSRPVIRTLTDPQRDSHASLVKPPSARIHLGKAVHFNGEKNIISPLKRTSARMIAARNIPNILMISTHNSRYRFGAPSTDFATGNGTAHNCATRSEEHTSELQSLRHLVCRF